MLAVLVVLLPLAGAVLAGLAVRAQADRLAQAVSIAAVCLSALLSVALWFTLGEEPVRRTLFTWIRSGDLELAWAVYADRLTAAMFCVVTLVSAAVHVYAVGYMREDRSVPRFMAYLSLFTFFMLTLVSADNFVQMFFGWEGVGLASYLLIGFWYERPAANAAAVKAFVVNRVGDLGFALGIAGVFALFGSVGFAEVARRGSGLGGSLLECGGAGGACPHGGLFAALCRGDGEVGPARASCVAAGRDGGAHARLGPHPCRDHGYRRGLHGLPPLAAF